MLRAWGTVCALAVWLAAPLSAGGLRWPPRRISELLALMAPRNQRHGARPSRAEVSGLPAALEELCGRAALPARLEVAIDRRLPAQVETAAYFLVSEALTNAAKHAQARQAQVTARDNDGLLTVEVADDGVGGATAGGGSGLRGMADRVEALGGRFTLSSPEGGGTVVRAELPCG